MKIAQSISGTLRPAKLHSLPMKPSAKPDRMVWVEREAKLCGLSLKIRQTNKKPDLCGSLPVARTLPCQLIYGPAPNTVVGDANMRLYARENGTTIRMDNPRRYSKSGCCVASRGCRIRSGGSPKIRRWWGRGDGAERQGRPATQRN